MSHFISHHTMKKPRSILVTKKMIAFQAKAHQLLLFATRHLDISFAFRNAHASPNNRVRTYSTTISLHLKRQILLFVQTVSLIQVVLKYSYHTYSCSFYSANSPKVNPINYMEVQVLFFSIVLSPNPVAHSRGSHGFSRGRDFACEVGHGLFRLGLAYRGKQEYSSHAKSSLCQFFYYRGEEQSCGGLCVRIVLSALLFVSATLELLFLSSPPHWALQLHRVTSR